MSINMNASQCVLPSGFMLDIIASFHTKILYFSVSCAKIIEREKQTVKTQSWPLCSFGKQWSFNPAACLWFLFYFKIIWSDRLRSLKQETWHHPGKLKSFILNGQVRSKSMIHKVFGSSEWGGESGCVCIIGHNSRNYAYCWDTGKSSRLCTLWPLLQCG